MAVIGNESVFSLFKDAAPEAHAAGWERLWSSNVTPWDRAAPSPALLDILQDRPDLFPAPAAGRRKKALVPGCGGGHDALLLASFGYDVVGLEISETALKAARENEKAMGDKEEYRLKEGVEGLGAITWAYGDFFKDNFLKGLDCEHFDLIYDYTFFCAIPMGLRPQWAARMSKLLSPTGRLVVLQFPNGKPLSQPGPPWGVSSDIYEALLTRPGEEISCDADGKVSGLDKMQKAESGLSRLELITPKRTHNVGMAKDGSVTDRLSVWGH